MTAEAPVTAIESRYDVLKAIWKEVQGKHEAYVKLLPRDELDEKWNEELNQTISEMEVKTIWKNIWKNQTQLKHKKWSSKLVRTWRKQRYM